MANTYTVTLPQWLSTDKALAMALYTRTKAIDGIEFTMDGEQLLLNYETDDTEQAQAIEAYFEHLGTVNPNMLTAPEFEAMHRNALETGPHKVVTTIHPLVLASRLRSISEMDRDQNPLETLYLHLGYIASFTRIATGDNAEPILQAVRMEERSVDEMLREITSKFLPEIDDEAVGLATLVAYRVALRYDCSPAELGALFPELDTPSYHLFSRTVCIPEKLNTALLRQYLEGIDSPYIDVQVSDATITITATDLTAQQTAQWEVYWETIGRCADLEALSVEEVVRLHYLATIATFPLLSEMHPCVILPSLQKVKEEITDGLIPPNMQDQAFKRFLAYMLNFLPDVDIYTYLNESEMNQTGPSEHLLFLASSFHSLQIEDREYIDGAFTILVDVAEGLGMDGKKLVYEGKIRYLTEGDFPDAGPIQ